VHIAQERHAEYRDEVGCQQAQCVGLIGGLGPGATAHYYRELVRSFEAAGVTPDLIVAHADRSHVLRLVRDRKEDELATYLAGFAERLKAAGAELVAISAVAPHMSITQLKQISDGPLVDMVDVVRGALVDKRLRRVTLFGTRDVIETDLFGRLDDLVALIRPLPSEIDEIDRIYRQIVTDGVSTASRKASLQRVALDIIERDATQAIVLAGTELALAIDAGQTDFPTIDCTHLHVAAIVEGALRFSCRAPASSVR
jgi:aspartate racemase